MCDKMCEKILIMSLTARVVSNFIIEDSSRSMLFTTKKEVIDLYDFEKTVPSQKLYFLFPFRRENKRSVGGGDKIISEYICNSAF